MVNLFVADTNFLISAHLLKKSNSRLAYNRALKAGLLVRSAETFFEFSSTFIKPKFDKYLSLDLRLKIIDEFELRSFHINIIETISICRDPKDDKYLSLAVSANANAIITGDNDLLVLKSIKSIPIISATEFIERYP